MRNKKVNQKKLLGDGIIQPMECRYRQCKQIFTPTDRHQKYCHPTHRDAENNLKKRDFIRLARELILKDALAKGSMGPRGSQ